MGNCRGSVSIGTNGIVLTIEFFNENWISLENQKIEKRIAITPEIAKKVYFIGFDVHLSKNYGST